MNKADEMNKQICQYLEPQSSPDEQQCSSYDQQVLNCQTMNKQKITKTRHLSPE